MTAKKASKTKTVGRDVEEFTKLHDKSFIIPNKIRAALERLGDSWLYEYEFLKTAGVSLVDLGRYRDQFESHFFATSREGKRVWVGSAALAKKLRGKLQ